jgi:protein gp37
MGIRTAIEWCDSTINPIMGCTGCDLRKEHCYAARLCTRYAGMKGWPKSFDVPEFFPGRLEKAIKWSDLTGKDRPDKPWLNGLPRHIFVNDLSDGFCPDVDPWEWLAPAIPVMHLSPHVWMLLTKWPDRMLEFFDEWNKPIPSNFCFGVSVENQEAADERIPLLLQMPMAVRFVSCEPLLGLTNLSLYLANNSLYKAERYAGRFRYHGEQQEDGSIVAVCDDGTRFYDGVDLHWIIVGGESGPGARSMDKAWVRRIRDDCVAADTSFFYKQEIVDGKKVSLPMLDGQVWDQVPEVLVQGV